MRVKICGITNLEDALNAIDAGADALGFVFYEKSPRYIEPHKAKEIISQLPPFVQVVGLFVEVPAPKVDFICKLAGIDMAQIHFEADEKFYKSLQTRSIKVVRAQTKEDILQYSDEVRLVDAFVEEYGGAGKRINIDWFDGVDCSKIILAGGLSSENIEELKELPFYALDVSSSVEESKGKKDKSKMVKFVKKQMKYTAKLTNKLLKKTLTRNEFDELLQSNETFFDSVELEKELLLSNGYPLSFEDEFVKLKTKHTNLEDQVFCIVDIETTAGKVSDGQIIELAAIKLKNGKIIDEYESLAYARDIPNKVQELTGIHPRMLDDAPDVKTVLEEFKIFLEDDVFVAHSVSFDYKFISDSLKKYDLGELCNRKLCTIDLAKRTIVSNKYGLSTLKELLQIESLMHHRAYYDVLSTVSVFKESFKNLPPNIITTEDLIDFSKTGKSLELKLDPIKLENQEESKV